MPGEYRHGCALRNPDRCRYGMAALPEGKAAIVSHSVNQDSGISQ